MSLWKGDKARVRWSRLLPWTCLKSDRFMLMLETLNLVRL